MNNIKLKKMKRLSYLVILITVFFISCSESTTKKTTSEDVTTVDTTIYNVKTIRLEKQKVSQNMEYTANLIAYEEINYAPAAPGRIEEFYVEVGNHVKKGDAIARMEKTQLIQANEQLMNARSNFERMDTLRKLNSISEQQYEAAKTQYEVIKSNVDFLTRNTTLVSPINGIVTGKYFEGGELYSGVPNTSSGKAAIVTLMQINPLKAKINMSERFYPYIRTGMKANVIVDILPDKTFSGEVFRVYPTISADSRTFQVELVISNPNEIIRPGMFARVALDLGETTALTVPAISVIKQEGTNERYVFIADQDIARKIFVEIGDRYDDKIEIISEKVKEGVILIVAGQEKLLDGSKIKVVE